jgi:sulfate transport system permease protein
MTALQWRPHFRRVLPGFGPALGVTLFYLGLIVLIPLSAAFIKTFSLTWESFWLTVSHPRVIAAFKLSFGVSLLAAAVNAVFGLLVAWVLVRYELPGKRVIDALVDLPFALPTSVAGIALTAVYADKGVLGAPLADLGIKVAFTPLGVLMALISSACRSWCAPCSRSWRTWTAATRKRRIRWAPPRRRPSCG